MRFDDGSRALYATDGSNYRQVPIGVVIPESVDDVIATVAACRKHGAPVLSRGGGTSLAGSAAMSPWSWICPSISIASSNLDPEKKTARVEPGMRTR